MQILYQLGICFTRWRTGTTGRRGYALEMDKQLSKLNLSRKYCSAVYYTTYHQTCISGVIWYISLRVMSTDYLFLEREVKIWRCQAWQGSVLQSPGLGWTQRLCRPGAFFSISSSRCEREGFTNCRAFGSGSMFSRIESLSLTLDQFLIHARIFWNRTWLRIFLQNPLRKQI